MTRTRRHGLSAVFTPTALTASVLIPAVLMLAACGGGSPTPRAEGGDNASTPSTSSSVLSETGPWMPACELFKESDVLAATASQHMKITVVDSKSTEDTVGSDRQSECRYNTKGVEELAGGTSESTGDNWVILTVREHGTGFRFPPKPTAELVAGVGDEAFWESGNPILLVRRGETLFTFESYAPVDDSVDDITAGRREVALKVAQSVMARLA